MAVKGEKVINRGYGTEQVDIGHGDHQTSPPIINKELKPANVKPTAVVPSPGITNVGNVNP